MKYASVPGCCSIRLIYNLGDVHYHFNDVKDYEDFKEFRKDFHSKIPRSSFTDHEVLMAITGPGQERIEEWLEKLGLKGQNIPNDMKVWTISLWSYVKKHKIKLDSSW